jgi:hypothetical protein
LLLLLLRSPRRPSVASGPGTAGAVLEPDHINGHRVL